MTGCLAVRRPGVVPTPRCRRSRRPSPSPAQRTHSPLDQPPYTVLLSTTAVGPTTRGPRPRPRPWQEGPEAEARTQTTPHRWPKLVKSMQHLLKTYSITVRLAVKLYSFHFTVHVRCKVLATSRTSWASAEHSVFCQDTTRPETDMETLNASSQDRVRDLG